MFRASRYVNAEKGQCRRTCEPGSHTCSRHAGKLPTEPADHTYYETTAAVASAAAGGPGTLYAQVAPDDDPSALPEPEFVGRAGPAVRTGHSATETTYYETGATRNDGMLYAQLSMDDAPGGQGATTAGDGMMVYAQIAANAGAGSGTPSSEPMYYETGAATSVGGTDGGALYAQLAVDDDPASVSKPQFIGFNDDDDLDL